MHDAAIEVVHVGSAARDLTDDDRRGWRLGGGSCYAALTTARLGLRTAAVIGVDAAAVEARELHLLREAGVELHLVPLGEGPVYRNDETPNGRVQTCVAVGRPLRVGGLPRAWRDTPAWSLVPVAGELGPEWADEVPSGAFVALGWQGVLRVLVAGKVVARVAPEPSPLVQRADLVGVSRHDLPPGTDLTELARHLAPGAMLVVTDGIGGGELVQVRPEGGATTRPYAAIPASREADPTGAGDVFLAALLASIVRPGLRSGAAGSHAGPDLELAAAAASLAVEAPGLEGVGDLEAVRGRLAAGPGAG